MVYGIYTKIREKINQVTIPRKIPTKVLTYLPSKIYVVNYTTIKINIDKEVNITLIPMNLIVLKI